MKVKSVHIFGGGTVAHIANHLAICAPAYGSTGRTLTALVNDKFGRTCNVFQWLTKMGGNPASSLETNEDVAAKVKELKASPDTKVIFFNCALVDYVPESGYAQTNSTDMFPMKPLTYFDKHADRLTTRTHPVLNLKLKPSEKIVNSIRDGRKDIFLVAFKTTCGANKREMYLKGLRLCKEGSANLVLVNDVETRWNMIVTPEEASYHETQNRFDVLANLVEMAFLRSHLTFTQSTVVDGQLVPWNDARVPTSLRTVVDYCVSKNAYKPFLNATVGHFAVRLSETEFLTSIRKSNFNDLSKNGLVYVKTDGPDTVLAYGAKPSVGGQSQRIVFKDHPGFDAIVHFHCPLRKDARDKVPVRSQREVECGSHQCGKNTSDGLAQFGNLKAVYLDQHGPNIVFPKSIDPKEVIDFIEANFDLSQKTGGYNLTGI